jgi:anti-sigma factor RsiW
LNCESVRTLVHAYIDDELDLTSSLELEGHLQACAACNNAYQSQRALKDAIGAAPLYYRAPANLRRRVQQTVRHESKPAAPLHTLSWQVWGAAVAVALIALITWGLARGAFAPTQNNLIAQEALASSMRALMAGPLTDVQSSDQHTVKPWFAGKLDFSPTVQDFAAQGFPLAGGRLDYLGARPVAALVYRHQAHVINLYTWPSNGIQSAALQEQNYQGYHVFSWTQNGMNYWAVSDMDASELRQFVQLVRQ